jgi:hypothetical protein
LSPELAGVKSDGMTKAERLQFLRQRLKRVKNGFQPAQKPQEMPRKVVFHSDYCVAQHLRELPVGWIFAAKPKPTLRLAHKRKARKSALTRIAEQLPAKLPRVLF